MSEETFNLPSREEEVLRFWKKNRIFEKSVEAAKGAARFIFFEGPPSANARPAIHHVLSRAYKDLFCRFKAMCGFLVERKAGWDTHGLPIEVQLERELGMTRKKDIEEFGVGKFNAKAKDLVWRYKRDWEKMTDRIGFWLDQKHPYITYDWRYMESLWWIIKEIARKGLLYQDYKVVPWCPRCGTPLASHEVAQGYKTVKEPSVYLKFLVHEIKITTGRGAREKSWAVPPRTSIIAWTTTPWTLPGNVALAVGGDIEYALLKDERTHEHFIVAKERVSHMFEGTPVTHIRDLKGKELIGASYEPLFEIAPLKSKNSYKVYGAPFVTTTDGTGVVHIAVMYGEEDFELGKKAMLPQHHTVTEEGTFTDEVPHVAGMQVKSREAEEKIISYLKEKNFLFKIELHEHEYPFCWRCESPLLYFARKSWFVRMSSLQKALSANNKTVNWVPSHIKEGRFGVWLKEIKDWAFSRNRYWGTPLPVWICEQCAHGMVAGSLRDLTTRRYRRPNTYLFVRHGSTDLNDKHILNSDHAQKGDLYGLNEQGLKEIKALAISLQKRPVDLIVSSDFQRTKETAELLASHVGANVVYDKRLREIDFGKFEGQSYEKWHQFFPDAAERFEKPAPSGENLRKVRARMMNAYSELERTHEGKTILIVSHGDPLWMLETGLLGLADEETFAWANRHYPKKGMMREFISRNWPYNDKGEIDMHRPFIDSIALRCSKCKSKSSRVPEVIDVWFDSGAMPFAQWHWPFEHKTRIGGKQSSFPADFIAEGIDQTRGWFYSLLAVSTLLNRGPAYRTAVSLAHVLDKNGQKMSKSKGNIVEPEAIIQKYGADALRWYFFTVNQAGEYKLFDEAQLALRSRTFVRLLWNSWVFFETYGRKRFKKQSTVFEKPRRAHVLDSWLASHLNETVRTVRSALESYDATNAGRALQTFVDDLSNWYIRRSRERFTRPLDAHDYEQAKYTIAHALYKVSLLLAPFMPFMAEIVHQNLKRYGAMLPLDFKESVHMSPYPAWRKNFTDENSLIHMEHARSLVTVLHGLRDSASIKVRQPLREAYAHGGAFATLPHDVLALVADEVNVKQIHIVEEMPKSDAVRVSATEEGSVGLAITIDESLREEGYIRELMRNIQEMRKTLGMRPDAMVHAYLAADPGFLALAKRFAGDIEQKTQTERLELKEMLEGAFDIERDFDLGEHHVRVALKKV